jgi:hypothetical protein
MDTDFLTQYLYSLIGLSPVLVAYLVGFILCLVFWGRSPGASLLALLAIGLLAVTTLGGTAVQFWVPRYAREAALTMEAQGRLLSWVALVRSSLAAIAYVMLFAAVFVGRALRRPAVPPRSPRAD